MNMKSRKLSNEIVGILNNVIEFIQRLPDHVRKVPHATRKGVRDAGVDRSGFDVAEILMGFDGHADG